MKKGLLGCLAVFVVLVVVGGIAAYRFVYLPGKAYVQSFAQLKVVPELDARITNQQPFTPPEDPTLGAPQVERFVRTQRAIKARLGPQLAGLETKYRMLAEDLKEAGKKPSITETFGALKELVGLYIDGKKAQVDALNAEGLSLAEYEWTRARVYEASGLPLDTTFQQIFRDASSGKSPDATPVEPSAAPSVPEGNRTLVHPYAKELAEGAPLAFFGL